ncbi:MAG TPA: CAP domain-containing protein [Chitinispirillaceae bacterium]|nr:CAP domain-containing protein [Chitinispirillaceae bacterium]
MKKSTISVYALVWLCIIYTNLIAGYGDCVDSIPLAFEREVHVMTNAVRMDPAGFREYYIKVPDILLPENYPAVAPLWYSNDLSKAARFHSVDMASNCGMTHNSCNGTDWADRIKSYYKASSSIAENVAVGCSTGLQTVIQWLRDENMQGVPAADKTDLAGHRTNIMNSNYHELGCGYDFSATRQGNYFWTQDFGGGTVKNYYKIPAGCHFYPNSSVISYAANYYDANGSAPESASVNIDGITYPLKIHLGSNSKGTYIYSTTNDKKDHCYYFVFVDGAGNTVRFPQTVKLSTGKQLCCEVETGNYNYSGHLRNIRNTCSIISQSQYRLDGIKITGKLQQFHSSGVTVKGEFKAAQKEVLIKK